MTFRDMTFCTMHTCSKWRLCNHALTDKVSVAAKRANMPISFSDKMPCYTDPWKDHPATQHINERKIR